MGIIDYIIIAVFAAVILGTAIYMIVKLAKMSKDEKKQYVITYLKGLVAFAEKQIGDGKGEEKLALVEEYFNKKAPVFTKLLLQILGKDSLKELIETALSEVKDSFEK